MELLNALGYFSTRYERLLLIKHVKMNELREATPRAEEDELQIKARMKTRRAARNNLLVCAVRKPRGDAPRRSQHWMNWLHIFWVNMAQPGDNQLC